MRSKEGQRAPPPSGGPTRRAPGDRPIARVVGGHPRPEGAVDHRPLGIGFVAFGPLSRGLSAGRLTSPEDFGLGDHRRDVCRFQGENFARNQAVVEQLERLARSTRSPA
jgi:hypothetical protein